MTLHLVQKGDGDETPPTCGVSLVVDAHQKKVIMTWNFEEGNGDHIAYLTLALQMAQHILLSNAATPTPPDAA